MRMIDDCRYYLVTAGISMPDADQLRRIAMTLHRWHEMECGDSDAFGSWTIARGRRLPDLTFEHDDNGTPWVEYHSHTNKRTVYNPIPDRERGALKRLAAIMARYPGFEAYVQGDPRGASLYILRPGDVPDGASVDSCYSRGIAVHK